MAKKYKISNPNGGKRTQSSGLESGASGSRGATAWAGTPSAVYKWKLRKAEGQKKTRWARRSARRTTFRGSRRRSDGSRRRRSRSPRCWMALSSPSPSPSPSSGRKPSSRPAPARPTVASRKEAAGTKRARPTSSPSSPTPRTWTAAAPSLRPLAAAPCVSLLLATPAGAALATPLRHSATRRRPATRRPTPPR